MTTYTRPPMDEGEVIERLRGDLASVCLVPDRIAVGLIRAWHDELWAEALHSDACGCERCEMRHSARAWLERHDRESKR